MQQNPYEPGNAELGQVSNKTKGGLIRIIKKVFIGFGLLFALIIALLIWAGFSSSKTYKKFEHTAEPFIKSFLNSQNPWDYEKAKPKLSKVWLKISSDEDSLKFFTFFNKLGSIKSINTIEWQGCNNSSSTDLGTIERCNYLVQATYESGEATIFIGLVYEHEEIKVIQLKVNSDVFMQ